MKWLIKRRHQTRDDLTVANAIYCWHASFWRTTIHAVPNMVNYLLDVEDKVGESFKWKQVVPIEIEDMASKKFGLQIF